MEKMIEKSITMMIQLTLYSNYKFKWANNMILADSNRSLSYLLFLITLTTSGCSQQSTSHISINTLDKDGVIIAQSVNKDGVIIAKNKKILTDKDLDERLSKKISTSSLLKNTSNNSLKKQRIINKDGTESIWSRMFSLYALPDIDNKRVDEEIKKFLKHPSHLVKIQRRAEPYLHLIMDEIEAKNIPGELALLPIIESSYRANVTSPASAAGLWQFIPSTGLSFGLKQNWWYDGRRDVYASTQAATHYLKKLSKSFDGNWFLALASYNVGIGNVKKAIKRNKKADLKTDYWTLKLPKETRDYVPKLLALAKLFANAEKYKLPLQSIPDRPFFQVINIKSQLDLKKAAKMANMKFDDFFVLNPAFNRVITPPNGPHRLLVKINQAKTFKRKLAKLPKSKRVNWVKHKVKNGENLKVIAKLHKTSIKNIIKINNLRKKEIKKIEVGKILKMPPAPIKTLVKA
jgi:membrane-bound lytic murein transglycosylase D